MRSAKKRLWYVVGRRTQAVRKWSNKTAPPCQVNFACWDADKQNQQLNMGMNGALLCFVLTESRSEANSSFFIILLGDDVNESTFPTLSLKRLINKAGLDDSAKLVSNLFPTQQTVRSHRMIKMMEHSQSHILINKICPVKGWQQTWGCLMVLFFIFLEKWVGGWSMLAFCREQGRISDFCSCVRTYLTECTEMVWKIKSRFFFSLQLNLKKKKNFFFVKYMYCEASHLCRCFTPFK